MPRKLTLYLDTSVPSQLFQPPEWIQKATIRFYSEVIPKADVFISEHVLREINLTPDPLVREQILTAVKDFQVLPISDEAVALAKRYVEYLQHGNIKLPLRDALHIAIATIEGVNYLVTWNMEHLAKEGTRRAVSFVNYLNSCSHIYIITPLDLLH